MQGGVIQVGQSVLLALTCQAANGNGRWNAFRWMCNSSRTRLSIGMSMSRMTMNQSNQP